MTTWRKEKSNLFRARISEYELQFPAWQVDIYQFPLHVCPFRILHCSHYQNEGIKYLTCKPEHVTISMKSCIYFISMTYWLGGSSMQHIQIKVLQCDKRHLPKILESSILSHLLLVFPLNSIWDSYKAARAIITANDTDSSSLDTFYSTLNSARLDQLMLLSAGLCLLSTEHVAHFSFTKL